MAPDTPNGSNGSFEYGFALPSTREEASASSTQFTLRWQNMSKKWSLLRIVPRAAETPTRTTLYIKNKNASVSELLHRRATDSLCIFVSPTRFVWSSRFHGSAVFQFYRCITLQLTSCGSLDILPGLAPVKLPSNFERPEPEGWESRWSSTITPIETNGYRWDFRLERQKCKHGNV